MGARKKAIPSQVKKGLSRAFNKFDSYQIAKYQCREREVTLRDSLFLVHANPSKNETKDLAKMVGVYRKLASNELAAPETWEKQASAGKDQKKVFTNLIKTNKLGALAMLKNLRNMQQAGVDEEIIRQGLSQMNVERVLPFRFITAAKYASQFEPELEAAMFKNLEQETKLEGKTKLLVDVSGSMVGTKVSAKSELDRLDAACALAMLLREVCETVEVYSFSNRVVHVPPRRGFGLVDAIKRSQSNGGTYLGAAVTEMNTSKYDRLIVFSDEQSSDRVPNPIGAAYMCNVASYQNGVGYNGSWTNITGFSESVVRFISSLEHEILD